jgi:hypothetical protein
MRYLLSPPSNQAGGWFRSLRFVWVGSWGAIQVAPTPTMTKRIRISKGIIGTLRNRRRVQPSLIRDGAAATKSLS